MIVLPTLRQLRYLIALADHSHFGRAAEACNVTQSTLSAGLQELERGLGTVLVERTRRRVLLTPLGEDVAARGRRLLLEAQEICELVQAAAPPLSGELRLGVIPTIAPYLLPRLLPRLRDAHPGLRLALREDLSARLVDRLSAGEIDLALLAFPYPLEELESADLAADPFVLVVSPGHPLADRPEVAVADIPLDELLLLEEGHCLRDHTLAVCRLSQSHGPLRPGVATSLHTVVEMVAGGLGITLLPRMALGTGRCCGLGLVTIPLSEPAGRRIGLAWRGSSPRKADYPPLGHHIATILKEANQSGA